MLGRPDPSVASKLAKICAMLTSSHGGERANAAALASRLLTDCGLTWQQLVERAFQAPQPTVRPPASHPPRRHRPAPQPPAPNDEARVLAVRLLERPHLLNSWERNFVYSILYQTSPYTTLQRAKLAKVCADCRKRFGRSDWP